MGRSGVPPGPSGPEREGCQRLCVAGGDPDLPEDGRRPVPADASRPETATRGEAIVLDGLAGPRMRRAVHVPRRFAFLVLLVAGSAAAGSEYGGFGFETFLRGDGFTASVSGFGQLFELRAGGEGFSAASPWGNWPDPLPRSSAGRQGAFDDLLQRRLNETGFSSRGASATVEYDPHESSVVASTKRFSPERAASSSGARESRSSRRSRWSFSRPARGWRKKART
jgi:hypothetical protein